MDRKIRLATSEDGTKLLDLILRAYAPIRKLGINFAAATADISLVQDNIKNNLCYVVEENHRLIATCSLRMPWGLQPGPCGVPHLYWVAVDPEIKKQGIASMLLTYVEETIIRDTLKSPAVTLGTADKHPWLVEMYEKRGYKKVSSADLGRGHTTIYFRKVLSPELLSKVEKTIIKDKQI